MGSLMAGWDSPVEDPKSVLKRNKSLTKEEIEAFWRIRKKTEEEHLQAISKLSNINPQEDVEKEEPEESTVQAASENQTNINGWWRRSNWAFLNEPATPEGRPNSYVPQFDVAQIAKSHANNNAISA